MLDEVIKNFYDLYIIKKLSEKKCTISTEAYLEDGTAIVVELTEEDGKYALSDKGLAINYINNFIDMKSKDVYVYIKQILKIYSLGFKDGSVVISGLKESEVYERFFDVLMCVSQISNMHIYFD